MLKKMAVVVLISAGIFSAETKFGRYPGFFPPTVVPNSATIENAADPTIYRTMAVDPKYYYFDAPKGEYKITVHYLSGKEKQGPFSVEVNGVEKVPNRPCYSTGKIEKNSYLKAEMVSFTAEFRFACPFCTNR
jgi:hypothetical protein